MLNLMKHWARVRRWSAVGGPPVAAAVLGNAFIGKDAMGWFRELNAPRMQLPLPAFGVVGAIYYLELGAVLYRAHRNDDRRVRRLAHLVLTGNELWDVAFFGRRDPRAGSSGSSRSWRHFWRHFWRCRGPWPLTGRLSSP